MSKALIAEIDHAELTVRLLEIGVKLRRPEGKPAREILDQVRAGPAAHLVPDFEAMATASLEFVSECINNAGRVQ